MTDHNKEAASICRLCGFDKTELFLELVGMPRWNHRLLREDELANDFGVNLNAYRCCSCGFVSVPLILSNDYYDDYINVPSLSPQAQEFQRTQAQEFVDRFELWGRSVVEIGCGDGFFLQAMKEAGACCVGVEPSKGQRKIAQERSLKVEEGVLTGGRTLHDAPFDAFVTRQVFEHVEDMRDFLLTTRTNLKLGAVGLIEVPNLVQLMDQARFFDFIPEHINYFTPRSLRLALDLAGFDTLEIIAVQEGESLRALVRWNGYPDGEAISSRVDSLRTDIATFIADSKARGESVAIWGAGGKGLSIMAVADLKDVRLVVDGDPLKLGEYTPVSHFQISSPDEIARCGIGAVIVTAPAYQHEIAKRLRAELGFSGKIVLAGSSFQILE